MSSNDAPVPRGSELDAAENAAGRPKPVHLSWPNIGLVAVGGAVGTGLRYLITLLVPRWAVVPVATSAKCSECSTASDGLVPG